MSRFNYNGGMGKFFEAFIRNPDGSWRCIAPVTLETIQVKRLQVAPGTVFVSGRKFMNVDVVALLDRHRQSVLPRAEATR